MFATTLVLMVCFPVILCGTNAAPKITYTDLRDHPGFYVWVITEISRENIRSWCDQQKMHHFFDPMKINGSQMSTQTHMQGNGSVEGGYKLSLSHTDTRADSRKGQSTHTAL